MVEILTADFGLAIRQNSRRMWDNDRHHQQKWQCSRQNLKYLYLWNYDKKGLP